MAVSVLLIVPAAAIVVPVLLAGAYVRALWRGHYCCTTHTVWKDEFLRRNILDVTALFLFFVSLAHLTS